MAHRRFDQRHLMRRPLIVGLGIAAATAVVALALPSAPPGSVSPSLPVSHSVGAAAPSGAGGSSVTAAATGSPSFTPSASPAPSPVASSQAGGRFGLGLLVADRGNGRLLIVNDAHAILWRFPGPNSLPAGQHFAADDAFLTPDGRTIVANDEEHQVIDRIDIVTLRVVWQYGGLLVTEIGGSRVVRLDAAGRVVFDIHAPVRYPSDAQLDPNGDVLVVDYSNPGSIVSLSPGGKVLWRYRRASGAGRLDHPSVALPLATRTY
jgi:hypothetical protein